MSATTTRASDLKPRHLLPAAVDARRHRPARTQLVGDAGTHYREFMRRAVVLVLLGLVLAFAGCAAVTEPAYVGPPSSTPAGLPEPSDSPCAAQFELAAAKVASGLEASTELAGTLDTCSSRTDWTETARLVPTALGLNTGETPEVFRIVRELCSTHPAGAVCEGLEVDALKPRGTTCDAQFAFAATEGGAGGWSEDQLAATLESCETRATWIAAAQSYPDALGMIAVTQGDAESFLRLLCASYPAGELC